MPQPAPGSSQFVADGQDRARAAYAPEIEREMRAQYAKQWRTSGPLRRLALRWRMKREVKRRLEAIAPTEALY
jgi:hypothetical protein